MSGLLYKKYLKYKNKYLNYKNKYLNLNGGYSEEEIIRVLSLPDETRAKILARKTIFDAIIDNDVERIILITDEEINSTCNLKKILPRMKSYLSKRTFKEDDVEQDEDDTSNCSPLMYAVFFNNVFAFNYLLDKKLDNINLNYKDNFLGMNALDLCIFLRGVTFAIKLINCNITVNNVLTDGSSTLHVAVLFEPRMIKYLAKKGANTEIHSNVDELGYGTPFIYACKLNIINSIKELLTHTVCNINNIEHDDTTYNPLIESIRKNQKNIVKLILETERLDINTVDKIRNALIMSVIENKYDIFMWLVEHPKINVNDLIKCLYEHDENMVVHILWTSKDELPSMYDVLLNKGFDVVNSLTEKAENLLMLLCKHINYGVSLNKLKDHPNFKQMIRHTTNKSRTLLHVVLREIQKSGAHSNDFIRRKVSLIADAIPDDEITRMCNVKDIDGFTPLMFICNTRSRFHKIEPMFYYILQHSEGCYNEKSNSGYTALYYALVRRQDEMVESLLHVGCRVSHIELEYANSDRAGMLPVLNSAREIQERPVRVLSTDEQQHIANYNREALFTTDHQNRQVEHVEPVVEPVAEPVVEPVDEPVDEPVAELEDEPVAELEDEPVVEPVAELEDEPVVEPVAEPVITTEQRQASREHDREIIRQASAMSRANAEYVYREYGTDLGDGEGNGLDVRNASESARR